MSRRAARLVWFWPVAIAMAPLMLRLVGEILKFPLGNAGPIGVSDPDSWLRLTLVRDWLSGGSWYDHSYAANAPYEAPLSPWTRPLDLVIGLMTTLQPGEAPLTIKLLRSALVLPLLWMGLLMGGLIYGLRAITRQSNAPVLMALLLLSSPVIYNYFAIGNADHHAPLAALWVWVVALVLREQSYALGGALLGVMLWLSPEALLPIGMVYVWLGLRWITGSVLRPLAYLASATALTAAVAVMIERPASTWLAQIADSISALHVLPLSLVAIFIWVLVLVDPRGILRRTMAGLLAAAIAAALVWVFDPLFFAGPMAAAHPFIQSDFLPRISEARSLLVQPPLEILAMLLQPLLALWILATSLRRASVITRPRAAALLFFVAATLALYVLQIRWYYYLYPLVALSIAPWLAAWISPQIGSKWPAKDLTRLSAKAQAMRRIPLLIVLFTAQVALMVAGAPTKSDAQKARAACREDTRRVVQSGLLDTLEEGRPLTLLAPTDAGGEILFFTHHRIVASNYHREGRGIRDNWQAQVATDANELHAMVRQRKVGAVLICPDREAGKDAVLRKLYAGELKLHWLLAYPYDVPGTNEHRPVIFTVRP